MFVVALLVAAGITLPLYGLPSPARLAGVPLTSYGAGLFIGFYAIYARANIPRMGAASFVAFILIAQLVTSALIDQFGLFGMARSVHEKKGRPKPPFRLLNRKTGSDQRE